MKDLDKSKEELIRELESLRCRISELEELQTCLETTQPLSRTSGAGSRSPNQNLPLDCQSLLEQCIVSGKGVVSPATATELNDRWLWERTFNGISDGIMVLDLEHRILRANKAMADVLGISERELIGKHCYELVHQEHEPPVFCPHSRLIADGQSHSSEVMEPRLGAMLDVRVSPVFNQEGRTIGSVHVIRDISDRKRAEQAMLDSEERLRLTLEATQVGIWDWDLETDQWYASPIYYSMLGYEPKPGLGDRGAWLERVHPDDRAGVAEKIQNVLSRDFEGYQYEARLRHADGTYRWQYVKGTSVTRDEDGRVARLLGIRMDITDRKRAEEALRESEELHRITIGNIADAVLLTDDAGAFTYVCPNTYIIFGYSADEVKTLGNITKLIGNNLFDRSQLKRQVEIKNIETTITDKDGQKHTLLVNVRRVDIQGGTVLYTCRDITDRKRAEEAERVIAEKYRNLFEESFDGLFVTSPEGKILDMNNKGIEMFGYDTKEEVLSLDLERDVYANPSDRKQILSQINASGSGEYEVQLKKKSGEEMVAYCYLSAEKDEHGQIVAYRGVIRDITERKRAENIMLARLRLVDYADSHSLAELLRATLDEIEALTGSKIGFYHFVDQDQKTLRLQAWSTRTLQNCAADGRGLHYDIDEAGIWVECVHERKPVIHNDYSAVQHRRGMPAGHVQVIRELVVPVFRGDRVVAILGVGNKSVAYNETDIATVSRLADLAWDIAERKIAEEALRAASLYNRSLIEASLDPLVTISSEGKITDVNIATELITGYSREEITGTDFACYFADPQKAKNGCERAFAEGVVKDYELEIRHRDGTLTPVTYNASVYRDSSGQVLGLFAAARDISRSREAEEKNLWLAAIVESSEDAIIGKTLDGIITSWNKGAASLYGYQDTEAVGKPIRLIVPPERGDEVSWLLDRSKRGEHVERYETVRKKKNGDEIDVSLTISPIRNAEGMIAGASTIARNITEQKSLQRQLLQAQKMESIGTLAGGIAHDFNNILTVVLGFSELLLIHKDERDPLYADLKRINQAARNGAELVQSILAFSRKTEINPRALDLNYEIEQAGKLLARTIPKMIEIELALSEELATVNADPVQIEQILMNLAVNARDAMSDGGKLAIVTKNVSLDEEYCRTHLGAQPGNYVLLSVSDTGHGMDKETLNRIFEPFYTTKGIGRGTGLGLAIVYGIVKQHSGYITCHSEPNVGTSFQIYLPAAQSSGQQEITAGEPVLLMGTETILLVDDEELVRGLGKRILERGGYTVIAAANGREALHLYRNEGHKIGLVILDIIMPEMGGRECLQNLRVINSEVKVLIASGYSSGGTVKDATELGASGFVRKPYDMEELLGAVRQVLDRK